MTAVHVCRGALDDEQRGNLIFAGDLVIFPDAAGLGAFRDRIDELVRARFGTSDPETAQFTLTPTEYLNAVRNVQKHVRTDATARQRLLAALKNTGVAECATYWDWVHLRVLPPGLEHAAEGTGWHRDTWASNVCAQTNWWTPIYPLTAARTIAFAPAQWAEPIANTSERWEPRGAAAIPEPVGPLPAIDELRVVIEPGDLLCFSGAHLHRTVPNQSGRARFSIEVRTVHAADVNPSRGAPSVDGHAPYTRYRWFHHVLTSTPLAAPAGQSEGTSPPTGYVGSN